MDINSTYSAVLDVLQRASNQNPEILKPAEEKLREWETQPGFYNILLDIISNQTLPINVRWIGILYMKIGVDRYWRKNAPNAIQETEKVNIKQILISSFNESVFQIAVQRAVLISKIARIDCPKEWPELFPVLGQAVESNDDLIQHRALLTLHHVVKAISSKRLPGDRKVFQEFSSNIYSYIFNLWNVFTDGFVYETSQGGSIELITIKLEKALLTLRIMRRLTMFGFDRPHENADCMTFMNTIFEKAKSVLHCRKQLTEKGINILELSEKFIIHLTKVLSSVLDMYPMSFVDFVQPTLEFTFFFLFTDDGLPYTFERFVIQCFNLIKSILLTAEYRQSDPKLTTSLHAYEVKVNFFQPQITGDMCRKLIGHYFLLTQDELEMWDNDPESFLIDQSGDRWKYSLRASMETVFVTIFREFRVQLIPVLLELVREVNFFVPANDMVRILQKEAVYNAVELCAFDLYDDIDFDQWFTSTLIKELRVKDNSYRILRRRVISLIGRWTGIKLGANLRRTLYEIVIDLLSTNEDMSVRLSAANTLKFAIDDFDFIPEHFEEYRFNAFDLLFTLLKDVKECETKMQVLNVITLLLYRLGPSLAQHSNSLLQYLPQLWQESEEHNMLRCAIVATLVQVVKAGGSAIIELNQFLYPIIQLGTDTQQNAIVYLLEDALELWLAVLEHSTIMTNELMQLFNNMPSLLEYSTENLRMCLLICAAHLLLAPELVMRTHGSQIISVLNGMIGDLKNEGVVVVLRLLDTFIRVSPQLGSETVLPILTKILDKVYEGEEYPLVMFMYLCIIARVLLASHEIFTRVLTDLAHVRNESTHIVLSKILDKWLEKMPNVSQSDQRKLLGLALTNLLTTQSTPVYERFTLIMINILETLNDITSTDENNVVHDVLVLQEGQSPSYFDDDNDGYEDTDHDQRRKQLILSDPVHTIVLKDYLQSQIITLQNQISFQQYRQLIHSLDDDTVLQFNSYVQF